MTACHCRDGAPHVWMRGWCPDTPVARPDAPTPTPAVNPHRTTRPEDTPAGDDQREALARVVQRSVLGEYADTPDADDYRTADAVLAWFAARPSAPTVRPDDERCPTCDGFVARPMPAPTVTTDRVYAALRQSPDAVAFARALGIEVTP